MYSYTNPMYEPRIQDFGDDYHLPDQDESIGQSILAQVKKIRRRYNNWFDYQDACKLYDDYMESLFDKYGGKKRFKLAMLLGQVKEYLPNYPELRKNKRNRFDAKMRITREMKESEPVFIEEQLVKDVEELPATVSIKDSRKITEIFNSSGSKLPYELDSICKELDSLDAWYTYRRERINNLKGKSKKKKKLLNRLNKKQLRLSMNYRSLNDMMALYNKRKKEKFMGINQDVYSVTYKGRMVASSEIEKGETIDKLKAIGVKFRNISKGKTKVIRKSKKKRKKLEKKNRKKNDEFIQRFTSDEYNDYMKFEEDMLELTGSRRFD